jgi:Xaa-Pro aminopeptidase
MAPSNGSPYVRRIDAARERLRAAALDALVVTHLPNVRYLTGFSGTAGLVVLTQERCLLVVDFRYATAARDVLERSPAGVTLEVAPRSYDEALVEVIRRLDLARIGVEAAWMPVARFNRVSQMLAAAGDVHLAGDSSIPILAPTERLIESGRLVKDAHEVARLREAARRLSAVARSARLFVRAGLTEQEVAGEVEAALRRAGFERPAFETIVASGPNGALPHARPGPRTLSEGEGVVLDFGGVYDGYCVDLTRTIGLGPWPPGLRRVFDAVAEAHAAAIAAVKPGVLPGRIDAAARDVLERHGLGEAFGHGTGHGLGLEVHEEPRIGRPVTGIPETPVQPGMVFTIEPGAYVPGLGGVRIEDDVLVTPTGCEVLTNVPVEL